MDTGDNNELLRTLFDASPTSQAVFEIVYDKNGQPEDFRWVMVNQAALEIVGHKNVIGQRCADVFPEIIENGMLDAFKRAAITGLPTEFESRHEDKGMTVWYRSVVSKISGLLLVTTENITVRKEGEYQLNEQAYFIKTITDIMPDIVTVAELPTRNIIYANRDTLTSLGFDATEISRMTFEERAQLIHPEDRENIQRFYERFQTLAGDRENRVEYRLKNRRNEWVLLSVRGKVFKRDEHGKVSQVLMEAQDITEHRMIERELSNLKDTVLRNTTDKYSTLFSSIDQGFCIIEVLRDKSGTANDYRFIETNPAFVQQSGIVSAPNLTMRQIAPGHEDFWYQVFGKVAATGKPARFEHEAAALGKYFDVSAFPIGLPRQNRVAILLKDISDRKLAENLRRQADERSRLFVMAVSDIIYRMSADWTEMYSLDGKGFLADTSDPTQTWLQQYIPASDKDMVQAGIAAAIRDKTTYELEHRVLLADGTTGWVSSRAIPLLNEHGDIEEWFGAATNITDRKKEQQQQVFLLELTDKLRLLNEAPGIQGTAVNLLGDFLTVNRALYLEVSDDNDTLITGSYYVKDVPALPPELKISDFSLLKPDENDGVDTITINDIHADERWSMQSRQAFDAIQVRAAVAVPIFKNGNMVSILAVHQATPRSWLAREIALIKEVAERTYVALERARAQEILRDSEQRLTLALRSGDMGTFEWTSTHNDITLSPISYRIFGFPAGKVFRMEEDAFRIVHPEDRERHQELFEEASRNGSDYHNIYRVIRPSDGRIAWIEERARAILDESTQVIRLVGVHWDVTEQINAARNVKSLLKQREEFIGVASHELKTPVTSIKAYAEIVAKRLEESGDHKNAELISKLNRQVDRLTKLIIDLLDTTRIEDGRLVYDKTLFSLNDLLVERIEEITYTAGTRRITFELQEPSMVLADKERIGQVITNLVSNAIKYSAGETEISISSVTSDSYVQVSVSDEGIGIAPEYLTKVFDRFYRIGGQSMTTYPGMGLGLYISAEIIKNHGGEIFATSKPGEGSVFRFTLPLALNKT